MTIEGKADVVVNPSVLTPDDIIKIIMNAKRKQMPVSEYIQYLIMKDEDVNS